MSIGAEFQMVCGQCGSLKITIENPEAAPREAIVYCGNCSAPRGTMGALRDLALRPNPNPVLPTRIPLLSSRGRSKQPKLPSEILEKFRKFQSFRQKSRTTETLKRTPPDISRSLSDSWEIEGD
jgi:hypothetical protein